MSKNKEKLTAAFVIVGIIVVATVFCVRLLMISEQLKRLSEY